MVSQTAKSSVFFYNKLNEPSVLPLAAIHEVLVLKSARASFTTPFLRVLVHVTRGLPQNKGFGGARANHSS